MTGSGERMERLTNRILQLEAVTGDCLEPPTRLDHRYTVVQLSSLQQYRAGMRELL